MNRQQRINRLITFRTAAEHGLTVDEYRQAAESIAKGQPVDLPEAAWALIASGESGLPNWVRG